MNGLSHFSFRISCFPAQLFLMCISPWIFRSLKESRGEGGKLAPFVAFSKDSMERSLLRSVTLEQHRSAFEPDMCQYDVVVMWRTAASAMLFRLITFHINHWFLFYSCLYHPGKRVLPRRCVSCFQITLPAVGFSPKMLLWAAMYKRKGELSSHFLEVVVTVLAILRKLSCT